MVLAEVGDGRDGRRGIDVGLERKEVDVRFSFGPGLFQLVGDEAGGDEAVEVALGDDQDVCW